MFQVAAALLQWPCMTLRDLLIHSPTVSKNVQVHVLLGVEVIVVLDQLLHSSVAGQQPDPTTACRSGSASVIFFPEHVGEVFILLLSHDVMLNSIYIHTVTLPGSPS